MSNRFCKKCLLDKVFDNEEYKNMQEYINSIDESIKTPKEEYKRRLKLCTECEELINGMCRKCGCFVELRASIITNYCPSEEKIW